MENLNQANSEPLMPSEQNPQYPGMPQPPAGLTERLQNQGSPRPRFNKTIIAIVAAVVLVGGAVAVFAFTDLKYLLPFFRPNESKLISQMYDKLAHLDGSDFSVNYEINVGPRDSDVPKPEETKKESDNQNDLYNYPDQGSGSLDFLSGNALLGGFSYFEDMIPTDLKAEFTFFGNGLSFVNGQEKLPDVAMGVKGSGKFNSLTMSIDMQAKMVADNLYYKVSEFPYIDITKGHQGEWIKMSADDGILSGITSKVDENQKKVMDDFRNFVAQTKQYDILSFQSTSENDKVNDKKLLIFNVTLKPENVPAWLEAAQELAAKNNAQNYFSVLKTKQGKYTEEEKTKIVEDLKKSLKNISIKVGLDRNTGELMLVKLTFRMIPPAESKKFSDKQFNSILTLKVWNQNNPSKVEAPDKFVDQEVIEREDLKLSAEQYNDYKQAQRIINIREALNKYYVNNKKFPNDLSEVTRLNKDRNTGQPYQYAAQNGNYSLVYNMNTDVSTTDDRNYYGVMDLSQGPRVYMDLGYDNILGVYSKWHAGTNTADRFSPIADQQKNNSTFSTTGRSDYDVIIALNQSKIIKAASGKLKSYFSTNGSYPQSLEQMKVDTYYGSYQFATPYVCEDLTTGSSCQYSPSSDGQDFSLKANFGLASSDIDGAKAHFSSYTYVSNFQQGENSFDKTVLNITTTNYNNGYNPSSSKYNFNDLAAAAGVDQTKFNTCFQAKKYSTKINDQIAEAKKAGAQGTPYSIIVSGNNKIEVNGALSAEAIKEYIDALIKNDSTKLAALNKPSLVVRAVDKTKDWIMGSKTATISIIEYSDMECPYCVRFHSTLKQIVTDYNGKVNWVYRHFPLSTLHTNAMNLSLASECAGELGGNDTFWKFLEATVKAYNMVVVDDYQADFYGPSYNDFAVKYPDTDGDGLQDRFETMLGTNPKLTDTDKDGYDDYLELSGGFSPLGPDKLKAGSWSSCISLDQLLSCAAYCNSVGKMASNSGVTSNGYPRFGAEAWYSAADCASGVKGSGQTDAFKDTDAGGARWKCFCHPK